jgi:hypothetical protein
MVRERLLALGIAVSLWGCAASPPVAEVRLVAQAFGGLDAATQPMLDDLALAERAQGRTAALSRGRSVAKGTAGPQSRCPTVAAIGGDGRPELLEGFCVEDSYYYADLADPPATRSFRRALAAVGSYTTLLVVLAEGRNIEEAKAQLGEISGNLGLALAAAGLPEAAPVLESLKQAFDPVLGLVAQAGNAQELERLAVQESPKVEGLIVALRQAAPELFRTLAGAHLARFNLAPKDRPEVAKEAAERIEIYRTTVSGYVVLLDQYRELLRALAASYGRPRGSATLGNLAQRSAQLSAQADAWRRTLAALRTGLK